MKNFIKDYQELIGKLFIAIAIVIFGYLLSSAVKEGMDNISSNLFTAIGHLGTLIRDGLLQIGSSTK